MQISLVLWDGNVGGAEKVTAELAGALRRAGADASVVFVRDPKALAGDLERLEVPYTSFAARRVEEVLWRPRAFAKAVRESGPDGALLPTVGHLAAALRIGGYRAPLVATEHGFLLMMKAMAGPQRFARRLERRLSAPLLDAEVAVSDFMLSESLRAPHARRVLRIYNGVDVEARPHRTGTARSRNALTVAHGARLIEGKGTDHLIHAFARSRLRDTGRLVIAGDGPEKPRLKRLAEQLGVIGRVDFTGVVEDMKAFWAACDVAVVPSDTFVESFGMVAIEAMACAKPVVVTRNGGLHEVVGDAGTVVAPGRPDELARALDAYAEDPTLRAAHGDRARARVEAHFSLSSSASQYLELLRDLAGRREPHPASLEARLEEVNV